MYYILNSVPEKHLEAEILYSVAHIHAYSRSTHCIRKRATEMSSRNCVQSYLHIVCRMELMDGPETVTTHFCTVVGLLASVFINVDF